MRKTISIFSRILLGILLLLTLAPFYLLVINSFKGQTEIIKTPFQLAVNWQFLNYAKALPQVVRPMLNSLCGHSDNCSGFHAGKLRFRPV